MNQEFSKILEELKKTFPKAQHRLRDLPGGKPWVYVPWQAIRDRLNNVCPDWQCSYSDPVMADEFTVIRCKITIAGISREGVGNAKVNLSSNGKVMDRGTPIERATADAFKNACESFGLCSYLDDPAMQNDLANSKEVQMRSRI